MTGPFGHESAGFDQGAVGHGAQHHGVQGVPGWRTDQRSHALGVERAVAIAARQHFLFQQANHFRVNRAVRVDPFGGGTHLSAVGGLGSDDAVGGTVEVGIVGHDHGGLAAQFERQLGDVRLGVTHHDAARVDAAGQCHHADPRIGADQFGDSVVHRQNVDHACGQPGGFDCARQFQGAARCVVAGAHHHRVAGDQRRCDLAHQGVDRIVERNQASHHADGDALQQQGFAGVVAGDDVALDTASPLGVVVREFGRIQGFGAGIGQALSAFPRQHLADGIAVRDQCVGQQMQPTGSHRAGQAAPRFLCMCSAGHCRARLVGAGQAHLRTGHAGGRVVHGQQAGIANGQKLVVDEILEHVHAITPTVKCAARRGAKSHSV